jgi:hypothetical protein
MEPKNIHNDSAVQLFVAVLVTVCGCALLAAGFMVAPTGQIHQSVLVGFGECLGSLTVRFL